MDKTGKTEPVILKNMPFRAPSTGSFELTIRCNLHCKMCLFRHDDSENIEIMKKELSSEQWIDIASQAAESGTMNLTITGGEPLLRPDFCEIWKGIYKLGFIITLYTNATLVTPRIMDTLREYPPHRIGVTLYGGSSKTYEKVTGNPAGFHMMMRGLKELSSLPSIIEYRTTVIKDLLADLDTMEQIVNDYSRGKAILIESRNVIPAVRGGCADVYSCRLSAKENVDLMVERTKKRAIAAGKKYGSIPKSIKFHHVKEEPGSLDAQIESYSLLGCGGGMSTFAVLYNGLLVPCQLMDQFSVNLNEYNFSEGWQQLPLKI